MELKLIWMGEATLKRRVFGVPNTFPKCNQTTYPEFQELKPVLGVKPLDLRVQASPFHLERRTDVQLHQLTLSWWWLLEKLNLLLKGLANFYASASRTKE